VTYRAREVTGTSEKRALEKPFQRTSEGFLKATPRFTTEQRIQDDDWQFTKLQLDTSNILKTWTSPGCSFTTATNDR